MEETKKMQEVNTTEKNIDDAQLEEVAGGRETDRFASMPKITIVKEVKKKEPDKGIIL